MWSLKFRSEAGSVIRCFPYAFILFLVLKLACTVVLHLFLSVSSAVTNHSVVYMSCFCSVKSTVVTSIVVSDASVVFRFPLIFKGAPSGQVRAIHIRRAVTSPGVHIRL